MVEEKKKNYVNLSAIGLAEIGVWLERARTKTGGLTGRIRVRGAFTHFIWMVEILNVTINYLFIDIFL